MLSQVVHCCLLLGPPRPDTDPQVSILPLDVISAFLRLIHSFPFFMTQVCPSVPFSIIIPALGGTVRSVFVHEQIPNLLLSAEPSKDREFKPLFVVAFFFSGTGY